MIDLHGCVTVNFIKKRPFSGSFEGMRYRLARKDGPDGSVLETVIWPEPFCFEATQEEKKHGRSFPLDTDGLWAAVDWLNEEHAAGHY